MVKQKMIPSVRFKGFPEEWDRKPTGALLVERDIQVPKSEKYPLMAFVAYEGVAKKGARYNREFLVNDEVNKKYKQTEFGDFIYSSNNLETGSIGLNNYGCASISPVYSIFQPTELAVSSFIGRLLIRKNCIDQMVRWRQGVVYGQWRIHESDFLKIEVNFPLVPEQQKIGAYFANLDQMIAQHQRKREKLVTLKSAMLKKMFPAPGTTIPEVRFKGFSEPWKEIQFDGIVLRVTSSSANLGLPRVEYEDIVSGSGRLNKDILKKVSHKRGIEFEAGDVLFGKLRPYLRNWLLADFTGVAVGDFWIFRPDNTDASFIYYLIQTSAFEAVANQSAGSKMPRSDWKLVSNSLFQVPAEIKEQQKIGAYFRQLDELIAQYGVQVEKLKQLKAACFEKMFV